MLIKGLGIVDLVTGLIIMFGTEMGFPKRIFFIFAIIMIAKSSLGMLKDFASWIDAISGIIFLIMIVLPVPGVLRIIAGLLLIQKGLFSFL